MHDAHSEPTVLSYEPVPAEPPADHRAVFWLFVATILWGFSFTWAKAAGEATHRAMGLADGAGFGPIFILGWRFLVAAVLLFAISRKARVGWTWGGVWRSVGVGGVLATAMIVQHLGLDLTSEAVTAFLTSLTILFVPLLALILFRKSPSPLLWAGVVVATAGIWLMTGATPKGFGLGEVLGLACAALFAVYILAVNAAARTVDGWQLAGGQFLVTSALCFAASVFVDHGQRGLSGESIVHLMSQRAVWLNVLLLATFPTLISFVLLNVYQPRIDPTRAALIYLIEPVFAAAFAWAVAGRKLGMEAICGAALILVANVLVEVLSTRKKRDASDA